MNTSVSEDRRSNHDLFVPQNYGSPQADLEKHLSYLGLRRLDFERCAVAGEVIYSIEGDAAPTSQQEEEARIATLAYALKKLGNAQDAAEFMRCLNAICEEADARYRQVAASYYYGEIARRGTGEVLKEMALIAMQLASLNSVLDEAEDGSDIVTAPANKPGRSLFEREVAAVERMIRGRRKASRMLYDEHASWLSDLESAGADLEELDAAFAHVEAMDQYDEGGAIIVMSSHERTIACGRADHEITADDLPVEARHLAAYLRQAYTSGVEIEAIWEEIDVQLEHLFPIRGGTGDGGRFISRANAEWQRFTRDALSSLLADCSLDCHLTALRYSQTYRRFYSVIRGAGDTKLIGKAMKDAYAAKESGGLSLKQFTMLKTAAQLQRERLMNARLSPEASRLLRQVETSSSDKLRQLSWAFYRGNQPSHPIHQLATQEIAVIWQAIKDRKRFFVERRAAAVMALLFLNAGTCPEGAETLTDLLKLTLLYHQGSRVPKAPAFHREQERQVKVTVRRVHQEKHHSHRA